MPQQNQKITIQGKDLIKELGLENLSVDEQEKLVSDMSEVVYERVLLRVVEELSDEEATELNNLFEKGNMEKIDQYLRDRVPDFASILKKEIEKYQEEMIKNIGEKESS